jgi:hypothetical protein
MKKRIKPRRKKLDLSKVFSKKKNPDDELYEYLDHSLGAKFPDSNERREYIENLIKGLDAEILKNDQGVK